MANVKGIQQYIGQLATPLVVIITAGFIYYFFSKGLKAWQFRKLGTSQGVGDMSNLANEVYRTVSVGYDRDDVSDLAARILALSNDDILLLNDKFVSLYGDECRGGGILCNDTTSLRTYVDSVWCLYGCKNIYALQDRLKALGL